MSQLKSTDIKKLKRYLHKKNKSICPVLKIKVSLDDMVIDHSHSSNARILKTNDAGLVRGAIHRGANVIEGKVTNAFIRTGLHKIDGIDIPTLLRNLADYLEDKTISKKQYIHPSEKPKEKSLKKTSVNKLVKLFKEKYPNKKVPDITVFKVHTKGKKKGKVKDKKLTAGIERLFNEFCLKPEFLKK